MQQPTSPLIDITAQSLGRDFSRDKGPGLILPFSPFALLRQVGGPWVIGLALIVILIGMTENTTMMTYIVPIIACYVGGFLLWYGWAYFYLSGAYLRLVVETDGRWSIYIHPASHESLIDGTIVFRVTRDRPDYQDTRQPVTIIHQRKYHLLDYLSGTQVAGELHAILPTRDHRLTRPTDNQDFAVHWELIYTHRPYLLMGLRATWTLPGEIAYL